MIPPRSILAAVDFSEPSRVALTLAARLAKQCHSQLHVLHAEDPLLHAAAHAKGIDLTCDTREELGRFMLAAYPAGEWTPIHHVVVGGSTDVICDIADREQVDLIVMGMYGMSGVERAMFGSTTEGVLRCADVSVLAVPGSWTPPRNDTPDLTGMGPVVAGIECEGPALDAAAAACRLAKTLETSVELIHVVPTVPALARWRAHAEAAVSSRVETARRALTSALLALGAEVPVRLHVESGSVAERLAASVAPAPDRHPILVLGRRARADRSGAPGATAYRVLALAHVPVLVYLPQNNS